MSADCTPRVGRFDIDATYDEAWSGRFLVEVESPAGSGVFVPMNLTGVSVEAHARTDLSSVSPLFSFTATVDAPASAGYVSVAATDVQVAQVAASVLPVSWWLRLAGRTYLAGRVSVRRFATWTP